LNGVVLNLRDNIAKEDIDKILGKVNPQWGIRQIQFMHRFEVDPYTLKLINDYILTKYPTAGLRNVFNGKWAFDNLDFLEFLPSLKNLGVDLYDQIPLKPINKYLDLESLGIGGVIRIIRIHEIQNQKNLRSLFACGKIKDIEIIGNMPQLEKLTFSMMTLKSLKFLYPLENLKELHFMLGGTKNLYDLPRIGKIEKLSFTRVRLLKIENLEPINNMKYLKHLTFDTQPHLTDLDWLKNKDVKVEVFNCKNYKGKDQKHYWQ